MLAEKFGSALDVFKTKSPSLIGVDIASTSIKLIELSQTGKGTFKLERYAIETLPKDTVTDGNIANLDQVADALKRGWKRLGSRNRNIAMALPAAMVITKKIIVPAGQKEEELELAVEAEANQTSPSRSTRSTSTSRSWGQPLTIRTRWRSSSRPRARRRSRIASPSRNRRA